jgi:hypothetical protein
LSRPSSGSSTILEGNRSGATPSSRALFADLEEFVHDHRPNGALTADANEPVWLPARTVAFPCGVVFERWVTPEHAELDLLRLASLN